MDSPHGTVPGALGLMVRLIFGLHLHLAGRCYENLHSARCPAQCKSSPGNNIVNSHRRSQEGQGARTLKLKCTQWKKRDKKAYCVFARFQFFSAFSLATSAIKIKLTTLKLTTLKFAYNIKINQIGHPSIQFLPKKCITREKLRVIVLRVAISGPHLTFWWT